MAYAGNLKFDTRIDTKGFNQGTKQITQQIGSIKGALGKIGSAIAVAFGVKQVIAFSKACIDLSSSLAEVQNVVDTTFGSMSYMIDNFATTAIESFGLSELSAKKYASSMGAMLKSMGMTQKQATIMSLELTKLSADIASFYNLSNDDAFYKLLAGMSGETEPLKRLGIDLRVANLEAFALSQGIKKSYNAMTSAEKAMLTYQYLIKATSDAQGDFARTSNSWANQTKLLQEQFRALQVTIGQGLIPIFLPVVQWLNMILSKLRQVASAISRVFSKKNADVSGVKEASKVTGGIGANSADASQEVTGLGDALEKAGKKAKGSVASFDEVNTLTQSMAAQDTSVAVPEVDIPEYDFDLDDQLKDSEMLEDNLKGLIMRMKELADLFKKGFEVGLGDVDTSKLMNALERIKIALNDIFTDVNVVEAFNNMMDSFAYNLGRLAGGMVSIGISIATNLLGGIANYLEQNTQYIKDRLIGIFDVNARLFDIIGDVATFLGDVYQVLQSDTAQQITGNLIGIFSNAFLAILELGGRIATDILYCLTAPFVENAPLIKKTLINVFEPVETFTTALRESMTNMFIHMFEVYDQNIAPAFENIKQGLTTITTAVLNSINTHIIPVLDRVSKRFSVLYKTILEPAGKSIISFLGKLFQLGAILWNNLLAPFFAWLTNIIGAVLAPIVEEFSIVCETVLLFIGTLINDTMTLLNALLDSAISLASEWDKKWQEMGDAVAKWWQGVKNIWGGVAKWFNDNVTVPLERGFKGLINGLISLVEGFTNGFINGINAIINALNKLKIEIPSFVPKYGGQSWGINIKPVNPIKIPRLAQGAVIPPNSEFLAMLGDQKRGVNIETPLDTMLQAFKLALSESGYGAGEVVLELDGTVLARALIKDLARESKRLGVSIG